jgi:hypothetical protein
VRLCTALGVERSKHSFAAAVTGLSTARATPLTALLLNCLS